MSRKRGADKSESTVSILKEIPWQTSQLSLEDPRKGSSSARGDRDVKNMSKEEREKLKKQLEAAEQFDKNLNNSEEKMLSVVAALTVEAKTELQKVKQARVENKLSLKLHDKSGGMTYSSNEG